MLQEPSKLPRSYCPTAELYLIFSAASAASCHMDTEGMPVIVRALNQIGW